MALTQMQIIQSLGQTMAWLETELGWGVPATERRHLTGRVGELYAALITNGQLAMEVNQKGYDVVSGDGERISVKTTAINSGKGIVSFNSRTLNLVDRIIILWINTVDMQIETLFDGSVSEAKKLMTKESKTGKCTISLNGLSTRNKKESSEIVAVKEKRYKNYFIRELENGSIEVKKDGTVVTAKPILRKICADFNVGLLNSNGNPYNTRQLGNFVLKALSQ